MKGLVWGGVGAGSLETTELKLVTAGIWRRGWWDVVRFGGDKGKLEIQVVKDAMVDCGEVLEFELGVPGTEPFEERNFVVGKERSLEDVCNPLTLLCVHRQVIDVTGNGGLT